MKIFKYLLPILIALPLTVHSQCRSFTKKKCLPELGEYIQNDNFNSAVLVPGDEAELLLTFYADKEYRLLVCTHPILGEVQFEVLDADEKLIYSNEDKKDKAMFDFKVASTQQLIVRIKIPESETENNSLVHEGCVSVMVGSKES